MKVISSRQLQTAAFLLALCLAAGCAPSIKPLPLTSTLPEVPATRMFAGTGEAYKFLQGTWVRVPEYDYEFTVLQRMLPDSWETIKEIHRRHPGYEGGAGPRDQTLYFRVKKTKEQDGRIELIVESSLGTGKGTADTSLEHIRVEFKPDISRFAPFNTYRLTQERTKDKVTETIELFKEKDGAEHPFMKMLEKAVVFERKE